MTNWSDWKIKKTQRELFEYFERCDRNYKLVEPFIVTRTTRTSGAPEGSKGLVVCEIKDGFSKKWSVLLENGGMFKISSPEKWVIDSIKENKMANVNYVGGEYNLVEVTYLEDISLKTYVFKADLDLDVIKDNLVVVESNRGFGLCKVVSVTKNSIENHELALKATAWVVDKVDQTNHNARKEATKRREYLIKQLEEKKQQFQVTQMYELMAKVDPEAAKLLEELKLLN